MDGGQFASSQSRTSVRKASIWSDILILPYMHSFRIGLSLKSPKSILAEIKVSERVLLILEVPVWDKHKKSPTRLRAGLIAIICS